MESWQNTCNVIGWGPPSGFIDKELEGMPFVGLGKQEKLGKFFDIFASSTVTAGSTTKRRGKEVAANVSKEDDMGFTIVESKTAMKAKKKAGTAYVRKPPTNY